MAKKIDFTALPVKDIEGNEMSVNIAKALGNQLYMQGQNVDECELGKKIYYSEGEMELHDEEVRRDREEAEIALRMDGRKGSHERLPFCG